MKLKCLSFSLTALALVSCRTVSREPAKAFVLDKNTSVCDLGFAKVFNILNEPNPFGTSEIQTSYLRTAYPPEAQGRLARAGNACERAFAGRAVANDLKLRLHLLTPAAQTLVSGKVFAAELDGPLFTDPGFAEKMGCYGECQSAGAKNCAVKCAVPADIAGGPHQFFRFEQLFAVCREYQGDGKTVFHRENFVSNLKTYLPEYRTAFTALKKEAVNYIDSIVAAEKIMKDQYKYAANFSAQNKIGKCVAEEPSFKGAVAKSVFQMKVTIPEGETSGMGFWIRGKIGETRLATAYHNYDRQLSAPEADRSFELTYGALPEAKPVKSQMQVRGALHDRNQDFWQSPAESGGPVLEVRPAGRLPQIGQRFFALGFPGYAAGTLKLNPCIFRGFVPRPDQASSGLSMQLRCDQDADQLDGMSGGPIVDDYGTVWGVITNRADLSGLVFASILGRDADGEVVAGSTRLKGTDLCLDPRNWSSRIRCN